MRLELRVNKTQNRWPVCFIWTMIVLLLSVLCIGCANKEEKRAKHLERDKGLLFIIGALCHNIPSKKSIWQKRR